MKLFFFIMLNIIAWSTQAQVLQDISGKPYLATSTGNTAGSPLLFSTWIKANVTTASGIVYQDMLINFDVCQNVMLFTSQNNQYIFSESIAGFVHKDSIALMEFRKGKSISSELPDVMMEVLIDSLNLFAKHDCRLNELSVYGGGTKNYQYQKGQAFFALNNGHFEKISFTKENARKVFLGDWLEIEAYADKAKASFKNETGWRKLIKYWHDKHIVAHH